MDLQEAQQQVWAHQPAPPQTTQEAIGRLSQTLSACVGAFEADRLVAAQQYLEDSLAQVLIAMQSLGVSPERGLRRAMVRMRQTASGEREFLIFPDRVEIQVGGEIRGGWPLYTDEDHATALQVARELGCEVRYPDAQQLDLFGAALPASLVEA